MSKSVTSATIQSIGSQSVKEQVVCPDTSLVSRVAKRALLTIAQLCRLLPYSAHLLVNRINRRAAHATPSNWHLNQYKAWEGLKIGKQKAAILRWFTKDEDINGSKKPAPGIFRIFAKALWFSPTKTKNEKVIQDRPMRTPSEDEVKADNESLLGE